MTLDDEVLHFLGQIERHEVVGQESGQPDVPTGPRKCPVCEAELTREAMQETQVIADTCEHGTFLDNGEVTVILAAVRLAERTRLSSMVREVEELVSKLTGLGGVLPELESGENSSPEQPSPWESAAKLRRESEQEGLQTGQFSVPGVGCPDCGNEMERINHYGEVVDVCREHGSWFEAGELSSIVEVVRAADEQSLKYDIRVLTQAIDDELERQASDDVADENDESTDVEQPETRSKVEVVRNTTKSATHRYHRNRRRKAWFWNSVIVIGVVVFGVFSWYSDRAVRESYASFKAKCRAVQNGAKQADVIESLGKPMSKEEHHGRFARGSMKYTWKRRYNERPPNDYAQGKTHRLTFRAYIRNGVVVHTYLEEL